jgi:DNA repair photolyase
MLRGIEAKTILNKTKRRDPWFLDDYTVNPYSACSFNCLYCYIRGSKYGMNMEDTLAVKTNAAGLLDKALTLRAKKSQYGIIVLSSSTDPYLQVEKDTGLTRRLLEVILKHRFPVHIITKSPLVERDFDLLKAIGEAAILPTNLQDKLSSGTIISFSFSTIDDGIGKQFEPGAPSPTLRLQALKNTVGAGFKTGVSMMPLLPYISDTEESLLSMFSAFKNAGAHYAFPASITLYGNGPYDSQTLVFRAIQKYHPHLLDSYQKLFASNTYNLHNYQKELYQRLKLLQQEFGIANSII